MRCNKKHKYLPSGSVLFDDEESDTEKEGSPPFRRRIPCLPPKNTTNNGQSRDHQILLQKKQAVENKTLESAQRSLELLRETKEIGIGAAQELVVQGEKLQNMNLALDEIDANLQQSHKDINGIKSVISSFKNYITGISRSPSPSRRNNSPHKRSIKLGKSTFFDTVDPPQKGLSKSMTKLPTKSMQSDNIQTAGSSSQVDIILETQLQEMSYHLTQLKGLGEGFAKELDHQNKTIDSLDAKIEQADIKLGKQNKDMNKILGK